MRIFKQHMTSQRKYFSASAEHVGGKKAMASGNRKSNAAFSWAKVQLHL